MQQVNLYTDALKPQKVVLSLAHMLVVVVLFLFLIGGLSIIKRMALEDAMVSAEKKALQASDIEQNVVQLRAQVARTIRDELLVATNEKLTKQLKQRERLVALLGTSVAQGNTGFSVLLVALGKQRIDSLWLTRMYFAKGGAQVGLEGGAANADSVPEYLKKLRQEPQFLGRNFDLFELKQEDGLMAFSLGSGDIPVEIDE